jgi:hypothetical protein
MEALPRVTAVEPQAGYVLRLTFSDGSVGDVDLADDLWGEMFEPLRAPGMFARVAIDAEIGTIVWPNGADFDPCGLYESISARPHPHSAAS